MSSTVDTADPVTPDGPVTPARSDGLEHNAYIVFVGALVVGAVVLRFWLALGPMGRTANSDETIVGLMALHLVRHHRVTAFYWGQAYGGSLEAILVAPFVAVLGTTTLALRFATVSLELAGAWITWRIARHLFASRTAVWAGLLALWWPIALVYFGTQERGFYPLTVVLGLVAVLMAVNIDEDPAPVRHWIGLGFAVGVGWWVSPDVLYYVLPIVFWLLLRGHWRPVRNIGAALVAFGFGSLVWIVANINSGLASKRVPHWAAHSTYWSRFGFFWQTGLPFALGLRRPWDGHWYWNAKIERLIYAAVLVAIILSVRKLFGRRSILLVLVAVAPFVFAYFPPTWLLSEGRYLYFVASMLPILFCGLATSRWGRPLIVGLVVVSAVAFASDYNRLERPISSSVGPITRELEREGYHTAIANYWIAYRMTYESAEHMIATPVPPQPSVRYRPYLTVIDQSTPVYVFDTRGTYSHDEVLVRKLRRAHIGWRLLRVGDYYAVIPQAHFTGSP